MSILLALFRWPWSAACYLFCVVVIAWQGVLALTYDDRQPVSFDRVEVLNSPIRPGETLIIRVWRTKVRGDCPITTERTATDEDGEVTVLPPFSGPGGPPNTPYTDVSYAIPPDMADGDYTMREALAYHCPRGLEFNLVQPQARFRVRAHPEGLTAPAMGVVPPALVAPTVP